MIHDQELGRYEFIDMSINSCKFYHIIHDLSRNVYIAKWGRIGNAPQSKEYTESQARKKISEKIKKGYVHKEGYPAVRGSAAVNFIRSLITGEEKEAA